MELARKVLDSVGATLGCEVKVEKKKHLVVGKVLPGGAADECGLKPKDVIQSLNGVAVKTKEVPTMFVFIFFLGFLFFFTFLGFRVQERGAV